MQTRQSVLNTKRIVVSVCWYGNAQLYYDGIITLLTRLSQWKRSWKVTCILVYTDDSLPPEWKTAVQEYDAVQFVDGNPEQPPLMWRFFDAAKADVHIAVDLDEDIIDILQKFERCWLPYVCDALSQDKCLIVSHMEKDREEWNFRDVRILLPANLIIFVNARHEFVFNNMPQEFSRFLRESTVQIHPDEMDDNVHPVTKEARAGYYLIDEVFLNAWTLRRLSHTTRLVRMRLRGEKLSAVSRVYVESLQGLEVVRALE